MHKDSSAAAPPSGEQEAHQAAAIVAIGARIDALASSARLWRWVALIAAGGFFEVYDLALAAPLSPGLVASGIFRTGTAGLFGFSDQATFIAATFLGLYVGVLGFAAVGDRLGRKAVFGYALIWYAFATLVMGLQDDAISICFWRLIAGIGLGAESVAIDCFIVEIVPKNLRGKAFGMAKSIGYCAIPVAALLAACLIPEAPAGLAGWRWLTFFPVLGAVGFWVLRRRLPESPRWLASRGRIAEAGRILDDIGCPPAPARHGSQHPGSSRNANEARPGYVRKAVIMMITYFVFQNIAYYGFSNWTPTLLEAQGVPLKHSLFYSFGVSLAAPLGPLLFGLVADRWERKHQIFGVGLAAILLGLGFSHSASPVGWIGFGIGLTFANAVLSFQSHAYLSEIFPTSIRARAVGFVYSFTRLSAAISGYIIAFVLQHGGVGAVFVAISLFMMIALAVIGLVGPKTRRRSFDEISGAA
ncbi:MAG TPA: MFS transporter [Burkholderiaceae bacterium]|nr:MFS transporter [Burkholderiaceae bacterium]